MLEWNGVDPGLFTSVLDRAEGGVPTVLVVEG